MGYIKHHAIVVTDGEEELQPIVEEATRLGLIFVGPSTRGVNGYRTLCICPDGSKEGWNTSDEGDEKRRLFKAFLQDARAEWVEVSYGNDDGEVEVTASAWKEPT